MNRRDWFRTTVAKVTMGAIVLSPAKALAEEEASGEPKVSCAHRALGNELRIMGKGKDWRFCAECGGFVPYAPPPRPANGWTPPNFDDAFRKK